MNKLRKFDMKDPIVEKVREIRLKIEQECFEKGISYKEHLLAVQERYKGRLVPTPVDEETGRKGRPGSKM